MHSPSVLHSRQDSAECCVSGGDGKVSLVEVRSQLQVSDSLGRSVDRDVGGGVHNFDVLCLHDEWFEQNAMYEDSRSH